MTIPSAQLTSQMPSCSGKVYMFEGPQPGSLAGKKERACERARGMASLRLSKYAPTPCYSGKVYMSDGPQPCGLVGKNVRALQRARGKASRRVSKYARWDGLSAWGSQRCTDTLPLA